MTNQLLQFALFAVATACATHVAAHSEVTVDGNAYVKRCTARMMYEYTSFLQPAARISGAEMAAQIEKNTNACQCFFDQAKRSLTSRQLLLFAHTDSNEEVGQLFSAKERQAVLDQKNAKAGYECTNYLTR